MNSTALITGGTSGIGLEIARLFAQDHYHLIIVGKNQERLSKAKAELEKYNVDVHTIRQDLSEKDAGKKVYQKAIKLKKTIEVLVNNAGFGLYGEFEKTDWETEAKMMQVNMVSLTELTKLFIPLMIEQGRGYILNVASMAGMLPGPMMAVYYATKAYVLSFTEAISEELHKHHIHVMALCPGATESNFQKRSKQTESGLVKGKKLPTAESVAKKAYQDLFKHKVVSVPGVKNKFLAALIGWLPRTTVRGISAKITEPKKN